MKILNLTQHPATPEQVEAGVITPRYFAEEIKTILSFSALPTAEELRSRAKLLAGIAKSHPEAEKALIGGALFFMKPLIEALREVGIKPVFAFSVRESAEIVKDGAVVKTSVFKHKGFVEAI